MPARSTFLPGPLRADPEIEGSTTWTSRPIANITTPAHASTSTRSRAGPVPIIDLATTTATTTVGVAATSAHPNAVNPFDLSTVAPAARTAAQADVTLVDLTAATESEEEEEDAALMQRGEDLDGLLDCVVLDYRQFKADIEARDKLRKKRDRETRQRELERDEREAKRIKADEEWVEELDCVICFSFLTAPQALIPCGHTICGPCAHKWIEKQTPYDAPTCPECRAVLPDQALRYVPNLHADKTVTRALEMMPESADKEEKLKVREEKQKLWTDIMSARAALVVPLPPVAPAVMPGLVPAAGLRPDVNLHEGNVAQPGSSATPPRLAGNHDHFIYRSPTDDHW